MKRRDFLLTTAATLAAPVLALAQPRPFKLVAAMIGAQPLPDPNAVAWLDAIHRGLAEEGWVEGANVHVEARYTAGVPALSLAYAAELAALAPDLFICGTTQNAVNARNAAPTIPLVFLAVPDPVGAGLVESISRPGGNVTGITHIEPSVGGKSVSLLLEVAPHLTRVGFMYNPDAGSIQWQFLRPSFIEASIALGVEPFDVVVRSVEEVGPAIEAMAAVANTGLVLPTNNWSQSNRGAFRDAVGRTRLPTVWGFSGVEEALISLFIDTTESFHQGAAYVGRILNGALPADLPVLSAPRHVLTINRLTAAAQGLTIPLTLIVTADRIIE